MGILFLLLLILPIVALISIYLRSLIKPPTNKIILFERRGRFDHCEGNLSNGVRWHFNNPRDTVNYDSSYPSGYTLPNTWQTWDAQQGVFTVTRNFVPPAPTFLETWFNLIFPGFYFMINQKVYRNFRPLVEYTDRNMLERSSDMDKRFSYEDAGTRITFYIKNDISDFLYFQRTYEVMLKVVTGVVVDAQNPHDPTPDFMENLELCLHFRIRIMIRDPKYMVYVSDSMADEIMAGLTQICNDVAAETNYLAIINSQETSNTGFIHDIVTRLQTYHATPTLQNGEWKFPSWNLLSIKFINVVGWNEKDIQYIKVISERALKIQEKRAEGSELLEEEKNVLIKNRINVSKDEAVGEGQQKSLDKIRPALAKLVDDVGTKQNKVLRNRPVHPDIDRMSDALELTEVKALSIGQGNGIVPTFQTGEIVDTQNIINASLGRITNSNTKLPEPKKEDNKDIKKDE